MAGSMEVDADSSESSTISLLPRASGECPRLASDAAAGPCSFRCSHSSLIRLADRFAGSCQLLSDGQREAGIEPWSLLKPVDGFWDVGSRMNEPNVASPCSESALGGFSASMLSRLRNRRYGERVNSGETLLTAGDS